LKVENGELSFYGNNNTGGKYALRDVPNVSLGNPTDLIEMSFDFDQAGGIDMDRFYFYFKNSETGAYLRVHYYERSRDLNVGQYSVENGYQDIYTNGYIDLRDLTNCRFEIHFGTVDFYLNDVWKGSASLDPNIESVNSIYIILSEAHYHFDNIKITNSSAGTLLDLQFEDGPYARFADYVYNTNDERIMTITSASTSSTSYYPYKSYIYNGNGQVMSEYKYNKNGTQYLDNGYIYGNGQKVSRFMIDTEGNYTYEYFHNNYLGSAQAITNSSGTVSWSRDYYPFGSDKDAGGTGNDYKFTGKQWDDESDLYYSWHRYYDPEIGRFIQVDPMWDKYPSLTPYHYCANNPLVLVDPEGSLIMNSQQKNAYIKALEDATHAWYSKYNKLKNKIRESGYGYLGNPRTDTILENPIPINAEYPILTGLKATISSIFSQINYKALAPHKYFAESVKYGELQLHGWVENLNIARVSDISLETLDSEQTLYVVQFINDKGDVIGQIRMNQEQYKNFLELTEYSKNQDKIEE